MKQEKNNILQSAKVILLGLIIAVGVSYVSAFVGPTADAPGNNVAAPFNESSTNQAKTIPTGICPTGVCGGIAVGTFNAARSASFADRVFFGPVFNPDTGQSPAYGQGGDIYFEKYAVSGSSNIDHLCIERSSGKIIPCAVSAPTGIDLTLSESQFTVSENTAISRPVTLSWTVPIGVSCSIAGQTLSPASNATGWPSASVINSSGNTTVTIEKFGVTTFSLTCTQGASTFTDTATYTANGLKTFVSGSSFTPPSTEFNSGAAFTVKAVGGGGGGVTYGGVTGDYDGTNGTNGAQTTVTKGSVILTALGGGGATFNPSSASTVAGLGPQSGVAGTGSSGAAPAFNLGTQNSNQNCGSPTTIVYGGGGAAGCTYNTGVKGGAGGAQSTTSVWSSGAYTYSLGAGGIGANANPGGQAQNGGSGAVRFEW